MSEMTERVARAIYEKYHATAMGSFEGASKWENISDWEKEFGIGLARAAIDAMREPTEAMIIACVECAGSYDVTNVEARANYGAMIDAALI